MPLAFDIQTYRDVYEKLKRDAAKLEDLDADHVFNFFVTAWHLIDWIKRGPGAIPATALADLSALQNDLMLQVCRDFANASKHCQLNYQPTATGTNVYNGRLGTFMLGHSRLGQDKDELLVTTTQGHYELLQIRDAVLQLYASFIQKHRL